MFFAALCAFGAAGAANGITSGLKAYIPVFEERFDWSYNWGGNDGISSLSDYQGAFTESKLQLSSCHRGYQCLEVGAKSAIGKATIQSSVVDVANAFYTFRVIPYDKGRFHVSTYGSLISSTSFLRGQMGSKATAFTISGVEDDIKNKSYSHNFYLDDVFLYSASIDKDALKQAKRMIVTGALTAAMVSELQEIVAANPSLTSIDLNSVTSVPGRFALNTANPNCLIFEGYDYVTNDHNVVKTTLETVVPETPKFDIINNYSCANLVITDGYPFDAMYSFTAKEVVYDREFAAAGQSGYMSTVCLPFSVDLAQTGVSKAYSFSQYSETTQSLNFNEVSKLSAGRPYVVEVAAARPFQSIQNVEVPGTSPLPSFYYYKEMPTSDLENSKNYVFHGTFSPLSDVTSSATQTIYGYQDGKFVRVGTDEASAVSFKPMRAYFVVRGQTTATAPRILSVGGIVNSINSPAAAQGPATDVDIYTPDGRRVKSKADKASAADLPAGVYIVGKKKILVRH